MNFDWNELAFGNKKPLNSLKATFIAAPRQMSSARFTELLKEYLPKGNILLGVAKEEYIDGFEGQPQFKTLALKDVQGIIDRVDKAGLPHKVYVLHYFQRELVPILQELKFQHVLLVRGSWRYSFHTRPEYYTIVKKRLPYTMISPFRNEDEAREYEKHMKSTFTEQLSPDDSVTYSERDMLELANKLAKASYDYSFQTGAALGARLSPRSNRYKYVAGGFNKVMPFQTYAMHYGAAREVNFTPPNDLSYYDAIHAEVKLLINAHRFGKDIRDTTLFINLMPCPTCSRMLAESDIAEVVYSIDHSDGYAVRMLEAAGKKVRRVVL